MLYNVDTLTLGLPFMHALMEVHKASLIRMLAHGCNGRTEEVWSAMKKLPGFSSMQQSLFSGRENAAVFKNDPRMICLNLVKYS